jgi:hypothetical protein
MLSKSLTKDFKGFCSRFTKLHTKIDACTLLIFPFIADKRKNTIATALV